jgi:hypothetical protein
MDEVKGDTERRSVSPAFLERFAAKDHNAFSNFRKDLEIQVLPGRAFPQVHHNVHHIAANPLNSHNPLNQDKRVLL